MGKYFVEITSPTRQHLLALKKSGQKVLIAKVERIFAELAEHPYKGTGKPENYEELTGFGLGDWIKKTAFYTPFMKIL